MAKHQRDKQISCNHFVFISYPCTVVEGLKKIESRLQYSENNYLFSGSDSSHDILVGLT